MTVMVDGDDGDCEGEEDEAESAEGDCAGKFEEGEGEESEGEEGEGEEGEGEEGEGEKACCGGCPDCFRNRRPRKRTRPLLASAAGDPAPGASPPGHRP